MNKRRIWVCGSCAVMALGGCATKTGTGSAIGAGAGAAVGAGIGSLVNSSAGAGALIGAGVGAISGALVGNEMDAQDRRQERELRGLQPTQGYVVNSTVSKSDVVAWSKRGISDEVIIDRIERSGTRFRLSAADENALRENGVSEEVLRSMKQTARRG